MRVSICAFYLICVLILSFFYRTVEKTSSLKRERSNELTQYHFRDGEEHAGEATFDDIFDGFNDGELSESCVVYVADEDRWVSIEQFFNNRKRAKSNDELEGNNMDVDVVESKDSSTLSKSNNEEVQSMDVGDVPSNGQVSTKDKNSNRPVDTSREKKKPSRDSTAWGKSTSITYTPKSSLSVSQGASNKSTAEAVKKEQERNPGKMEKTNKRKKSNHIKPPPKLMKYVTQCIMQFEMIQEGDRLLLGLSGGKDSLTLLHILLELKRKLKTNFEIEVCTIDPMTPSFDPSPLIPYVESLGLKYHFVKDNIVERANSGGKF